MIKNTSAPSGAGEGENLFLLKQKVEPNRRFALIQQHPAFKQKDRP